MLSLAIQHLTEPGQVGKQRHAREHGVSITSRTVYKTVPLMWHRFQPGRQGPDEDQLQGCCNRWPCCTAPLFAPKPERDIHASFHATAAQLQVIHEPGTSCPEQHVPCQGQKDWICRSNRTPTCNRALPRGWPAASSTTACSKCVGSRDSSALHPAPTSALVLPLAPGPE